MNDWFSQLVRLIERRTGLIVRAEARTGLAKEIEEMSRVKLGMDTDTFLTGLQQGNTGSTPVWNELMALLTVGESYFFRDKGQCDLLRDHILPTLISQNKSMRKLRIWSAACASGEEAYSIAILLSQLLSLLDPNQKWDICIMATDVNQSILNRARTGIYSDWSFRQVDPGLQSRYFTRQAEGWKINQDIQDMVTFAYGNLVEDEFPNLYSGLYSFDFIICRNVFIYFLPKTINLIAKKMAACLTEHGYLMTGHSEFGMFHNHDLKVEWIDQLIIYRKDVAAKAQPDARPVTGLIAGNRRPPKFSSVPALDSGAISSFTPSSNLVPPPQQAHKKIAQASPHPSSEPIADFTLLLKHAKKHAGQGNYDLAVADCHKAIALNHDSPLPYFVLSQIAEILGKRQESKELLNKALYIDHEFLAGHIELFNIYKQESDKKKAEKMLDAALQIARNMPEKTSIEFYDGHSVSELLKVLDQYKAKLSNGG